MPRRVGRPARSSRSGGLLVLVTCPGRKVGETIGHTLVQERLAACVNVAPNLTAIYRDLHPYTIPEIVALPLVGGSAPYLAWLRNSTT